MAQAGMPALVWAAMNRSYRRPEALPTRPTPITVDLLTAITAPVELAEPITEKGVPSHA